MKVTKRWLESRDAPQDVLELLENARGPRPLDAAARARSRRRLAALGAVPAAAGVTFWLQKVAWSALLGAAVGGAVLAPQWLTTGSSGGEPAAPALNSNAAPVGAYAPSASAAETVATNAPTASPPRDVAVTPSAPSGAADVEREARLLEAARRLLAAQPAAALRVLSRHEREFRAGTLVVEREFLRVEALVRLGRLAEARERATALKRLAPGHLYEQRLKALLGDAL